MEEALTKVCRCCGAEKSINEYHKDNSKKDGYRTLCKSCVKQYAIDNKKRIAYTRLVWYDKNKESIKAYDAARYKANAEDMRKRSSKYKKNNPDVVAKYKETHKEYCRLYSAAWYEQNKERLVEVRYEYRLKNSDVINEKNRVYYKENKERISVKHRRYHKNNKHITRASGARRRAAKCKAIPPWADLDKIKLIYKNCHDICEETNYKYHVDHIVPLQNKFVCGLHCEYNLQILTEEENLSKSNSYWPDMPEYRPEDLKELNSIRKEYEKECINH